MEVDFDLSDVFFVCTSNSMNIPPALLDRMEVIRLPGYTEEEKLKIAERYLTPKQKRLTGLKDGDFELGEDALRHLVRYYTREAGVRGLEREIAKICRKIVTEQAFGERESGPAAITEEDIERYNGVRRFTYGLAEEANQVGVATGLAWTSAGGELLSIEAIAVPGKGRQIKTGSLGDVMQESIQAAMTFVRSRAAALGIPADHHESHDIHIHVPEGATPKDGPSAGVGMCTALVSVITGIPVSAEVAMTGEITLRGQVLRIGGLKEKLLAARRGGVRPRHHPEGKRTRPKGNPRQRPRRPHGNARVLDGRNHRHRPRTPPHPKRRRHRRTPTGATRRTSARPRGIPQHPLTGRMDR